MNKAQVIHQLGAPDVMTWQDWPLDDPAPGEVRLRHTAVGVNYADTYHRGGISHPWPVPAPPVIILRLARRRGLPQGRRRGDFQRGA